MGSRKHKKHKSENKSIAETEDNGSLKLKLNIKLGGNQDLHQDASECSLSDEKRHKHKKRKKKKSSDRDRERQKYSERDDVSENSLKRKREEESEDEEDEEEEEEEEEDDEMVQEDEGSQVSSRVGLDFTEDESDGNSSPSRRREPRTCTIRDNDGTILKHMLNHLLKILQNKDVNGFFAFPVTDSIAPGYSTIIPQPMDFSTIATKIEAHEYRNVMEFKKDFILMCNNAMTYNRPDTIYFKEAKRLQMLGIRQLSKEKLLHLKKTHSFLASITLRELGFDESGFNVETAYQIVNREPVEDTKEEIKNEDDAAKLESVAEDDLSPEEILAQAQNAAKSAKEKLTKRKPKTDLGFLRMEDDGTTSMTILNPWNDGMVSSTQRVISLGDYMGKLKNGSGSLFKFKEDKRNKICAETYLNYGPFSSHAPMYDSSFATCTKEESDLLLHTYGGEIGVQYAKSVQKFVEGAGISAIEMVDRLLDTLTHGQHSKAKIVQEQQQQLKDEEKAFRDEMAAKASQRKVEEPTIAESRDPVQKSLNATAAMLSQLSETQSQRLSQDPPAHIAYTPPLSDKEADLANKVSSSLVSMTRKVHPRDVISTGAVRGALGITKYPVKPQKPVSGSNQLDVSKSSDEDSDSDDDDDDEDDEDESEEESGKEEEVAPLSDNNATSVGNPSQSAFNEIFEVDSS